MKSKLKYYIGSILMGSIALFSALHPERYHAAIPFMFGAFTVFKVLAKCKTSRNQTEFANSANCPTVCMTIVKPK